MELSLSLIESRKGVDHLRLAPQVDLLMVHVIELRLYVTELRRVRCHCHYCNFAVMV